MTMPPARRVAAVLLVPLALTLLAAPARAADGKLEYNKDVRPILAENCFACHGPDSAARKANLRLDRRDDALKAKVLVPGKPDESPVVVRIESKEATELMPPAKSHKKLTASQKTALRRWVAEGAEYQPHWSLITPQRPAAPRVKNAQWVRNPIDAFILASLEKVGLEPAPEADRRTLARRASLDLTGLLPDPADVDAFVNDPAADAYERFVDKLLASPQWGEHRARYWLDMARYGDTNGIHFDNYREIHSYRDWVIKAFNDNMPFDRFTIEQLAGDLLPNATLDQRVATGFNRCNITTNEGGAIAEEYLVLYNRDRIETVAAVWMGLTANCTVCHDHKFDPLLQREFYQMAAFFNNTTQGAMDGNIKDTPPIILVPSQADKARWDVLARELDDLRKGTEARKQAAAKDFDGWLKTAKEDEIRGKLPGEGLHLSAGLSEGDSKGIHYTLDGKAETADKEAFWGQGHVAAKAFKTRPGEDLVLSAAGDFEKDKGFSYGAWVRLPKNGTSGALFARMDDKNEHRGWDLWVQNNQPGVHIIHKWPTDALKVVSRTPLKPNQWYHLFVTYDGSGKAAGVKVYIDGTPQPVNVEADALANSIRTEVPWKLGQRHSSSPVDDALIQDVRLYNRALSGLEVDLVRKTTRAAFLLGNAKRTPQEQNELFEWYLTAQDQAYRDLTAKLAGLAQEEAAIRSRGTVAHVMNEKPGEPTAYILYRGDYDKRRDQVKAGTPQMLPPMPDDLPHNRLGFAKWLLLPEHPLTSRVTVNRYWQEVFGTGLVRTSGDFGVAGEPPSHPELLDWLAVEFREGGWDIKKFFKLLVTSAAYRQSAVQNQAKRDKDPHNRLLSRGPRFRMDGEMIRDNVLAGSGLLVKKIGGPSVRPYQPPGVWEAVAMIGSNTRDYKRDTGDNLYRRSMYTFWKRAAPPASMEVFNAPAREFCTVRRERTNTPLQALVTLNDVQNVEAARVLAELTLKQPEARFEARADFMARRLLARSLRAEEQKILQEVFADLLEHYQKKPEDAGKLIRVGESQADPKLDAPTLAAWTLVANQLMNLDEFLNK